MLSREDARYNPAEVTRAWKKDVVIEVKVAADTPGGTREAAEASAVIWNDAAGREVVVISGDAPPRKAARLYDTLSDDETVIYGVSNWKSSTGKVGSTIASTIWAEEREALGRIVASDILLNTETYEFIDVLTEEKKGVIVDVQSVIIHEIGHMLGLDHADEQSASAMAPEIGLGEVKRNLTDSDKEEAKNRYGT